MFPTTYPYWISRINSQEYRFTFPTLSEASFTTDAIGKGRSEVSERVLNALQVRIKINKIPYKRDVYAGEEAFTLSPSHQTKLMLIEAAQKEKVRPAELARLLGVAPQEGQRILNFLHPTKIDTMANALKELGYRVKVTVEKI